MPQRRIPEQTPDPGALKVGEPRTRINDYAIADFRSQFGGSGGGVYINVSTSVYPWINQTSYGTSVTGSGTPADTTVSTQVTGATGFPHVNRGGFVFVSQPTTTTTVTLTAYQNFQGTGALGEPNVPQGGFPESISSTFQVTTGGSASVYFNQYYPYYYWSVGTIPQKELAIPRASPTVTMSAGLLGGGNVSWGWFSISASQAFKSPQTTTKLATF